MRAPETTDPLLDAFDGALSGRDVPAEFAGLDDVVAALRADAPQMTRTAAASVEERVLRRARAPRKPRWTPRQRWRLVAGGGATALAATIAFAVAGGITQTGSPTPQRDVKQSSLVPAHAGYAPFGLAVAPQGSASGASTAARAPARVPAQPTPARPPAGGARQVQRDATLALTAPMGQLQSVADHVVAVTDAFGGIVRSSNVTTNDAGSSQANFDLLVLSARLDATLAALSKLAHVSSRTENTLDITNPTTAAQDRLDADRAERSALLRQLVAATTPGRIAAIRAQLSLLASQIARDAGQLATLHSHATYSDLGVTVLEGNAGSAAGGGWSLGQAADDALAVLVAAAGGLLIALAVLVPLSLLGAAGWTVAALARRRRRERVLGPDA